MQDGIIAISQVRYLLSLNEQELDTLLKTLNESPDVLNNPPELLIPLIKDIKGHQPIAVVPTPPTTQAITPPSSLPEPKDEAPGRRCDCRVASDLIEWDYHIPKCRFRLETEEKQHQEEKELGFKPYNHYPSPEVKVEFKDPPKDLDTRAREVAQENPPLTAPTPPGLKRFECKDCRRNGWADDNPYAARIKLKCYQCLGIQGRENRVIAIKRALKSQP